MLRSEVNNMLADTSVISHTPELHINIALLQFQKRKFSQLFTFYRLLSLSIFLSCNKKKTTTISSKMKSMNIKLSRKWQKSYYALIKINHIMRMSNVITHYR